MLYIEAAAIAIMPLRSSTTAFAKSTRPEISGAVQRESLFACLDATPARTIAWISAPPGFGKTTLAASYVEARELRSAWFEMDADDSDGETFFHYLSHAVRKLRADGEPMPIFEPDHRADLAAFSRRYFRTLFAEVGARAALVIDNVNTLGAESPLRTILEAGLPQIPRGALVIVTSREPPPPGLTRLQASGAMVTIGATELKLTTGELAEMARRRGKPLPAERLARLHAQSDGWAAALVLMVEHLKLSPAASELPEEATPRAVFDYLAGEVFERFDPPTQRLLLQVACLPRVTIEVARALAGDDAAARVLFNLAHNDYFVREHVGAEGRVFVFHPLLREFLLRRAARDMPQALGADALRRAARLLREAGQPEDALTLFVERRDWSEVAAIIVEQADTWLAQGRQTMLAAWIELLPAASVTADPRLMLAQARAIAHVSPRNARRRFEEAFALVQRGGEQPAMRQCCLGVLDTILREFDDLAGLDHWLAVFARLGDGDDNAVPAEVLVARMWREPGHPSVGRLHELDASASGAHGLLARSIAALLNGDFAAAAAAAQRIVDASAPAETRPLASSERGAAPLALATCNALRLLFDGDPRAALSAARAGLELATALALHTHDNWLRLLAAAALLATSDLDAARGELELVEAAPLRRGDRAFVHHLRAALAAAAGQAAPALREARSAVLLAVEAGLPWLECLARLAAAQRLADTGDRAGAQAQVRAAELLAQRLGSALLRLAALFVDAAVALAASDEGAAVAPLQTGLALARDLGVHHVPELGAEALARLCALALKRGFAVEQTRTLIATAKLLPPPAAQRLRRWPWPFEIVTLGSFDLRQGGEPIEFSAKGPGRPIELLKVLLALGGRNVRTEQLADALWPRVDADYAHKSFTAALHRLRRIFGEDDVVRLRDGRVSLSESLVWSDAWALERALDDIETLWRDGRIESALSLRADVDDVLSLYKGPFLGDDASQPAFLGRREQLRARLLRVLGRVTRQWEEDGRAAAAIDAYQRCIDADEACEAFHRQLMQVQQRQGDSVEALATYERLQATLLARSSSQPSPETQAVYERLRR